MKNNITIENFKVRRHEFKLTGLNGDRELLALLPTVNMSERCEFNIHGVNNSIANAIRRTVMSEIPVKNLNFNPLDLTTDNPFILVDFIQSRIRLIPIKQSAQGTFSLEAYNNTSHLIRVYSRDLKRTSGPRENIFNETFELFTLDPGQFLKIKNIYIDSGFGYVHAGYTDAFSGRILPLTEEQWNPNELTGIRSSESDETSYTIAFNTNGTIDAKTILRMSCQQIIDRAKTVVSLLDNINSNTPEYTLTIPNESTTIGELLDRAIYTLYPDIDYVGSSKASIGRSITLKLRTDEDPKIVISTAAKAIVDVFTEIESLLN